MMTGVTQRVWQILLVLVMFTAGSTQAQDLLAEPGFDLAPTSAANGWTMSGTGVLGHNLGKAGPSPPLFADGFESGSTNAWSTLAPRCGVFTELQCIQSGECTLNLVDEMTGEYVCRRAEGPCEPAFSQHIDTAESCEAKEGCVFVPGVCYCAPDVICFCGGGPPPQCVESS